MVFQNEVMELMVFEAIGAHPFLWFFSFIYLHEASYPLGETTEKWLCGNKGCIPIAFKDRLKDTPSFMPMGIFRN